MRSPVPCVSSIYLFIHLPAPQCKQYRRGQRGQVNMVNYLPAFSPDWLDEIQAEHADTSLRVLECTCERIHVAQVDAAAADSGAGLISRHPPLCRSVWPAYILLSDSGLSPISA